MKQQIQIWFNWRTISIHPPLFPTSMMWVSSSFASGRMRGNAGLSRSKVTSWFYDDFLLGITWTTENVKYRQFSMNSKKSHAIWINRCPSSETPSLYKGNPIKGRMRKLLPVYFCPQFINGNSHWNSWQHLGTMEGQLTSQQLAKASENRHDGVLLCVSPFDNIIPHSLSGDTRCTRQTSGTPLWTEIGFLIDWFLTDDAGHFMGLIYQYWQITHAGGNRHVLQLFRQAGGYLQ